MREGCGLKCHRTSAAVLLAALVSFWPGNARRYRAKKRRDKPGRGGVSACPSGRTAPSIWNNSVNSVQYHRTSLLPKWCYRAPSSIIYPRPREVKRLGNPAATRPLECRRVVDSC